MKRQTFFAVFLLVFFLASYFSKYAGYVEKGDKEVSA
jgi:hypothetical protein